MVDFFLTPIGSTWDQVKMNGTRYTCDNMKFFLAFLVVFLLAFFGSFQAWTGG